MICKKMRNFRLQVLLCAATVWTVACTEQPASAGYTINGEIAGVTGTVYLSVFEGKQPRVVDSAEVINGAFRFRFSLRMGNIRKNH